MLTYVPPVTSMTPIARFVSASHFAVLATGIQSTGFVQYKHLLVVFDAATEEPVFIVSAENFAGGDELVMGIFDENGHATLEQQPDQNLDDVLHFAANAVHLTNHTLGISLDLETPAEE